MAALSAEKLQLVASANILEATRLQKELNAIDVHKRNVANRISVDQAVLYRRFLAKLNRTKLSYARLLGDHEGIEKYRTKRALKLNVELSNEGDFEFIKRLQHDQQRMTELLEMKKRMLTELRGSEMEVRREQRTKEWLDELYHTPAASDDEEQGRQGEQRRQSSQRHRRQRSPPMSPRTAANPEVKSPLLSSRQQSGMPTGFLQIISAMPSRSSPSSPTVKDEPTTPDNKQRLAPRVDTSTPFSGRPPLSDRSFAATSTARSTQSAHSHRHYGGTIIDTIKNLKIDVTSMHTSVLRPFTAPGDGGSYTVKFPMGTTHKLSRCVSSHPVRTQRTDVLTVPQISRSAKKGDAGVPKKEVTLVQPAELEHAEVSMTGSSRTAQRLETSEMVDSRWRKKSVCTRRPLTAKESILGHPIHNDAVGLLSRRRKTMSAKAKLFDQKPKLTIKEINEQRLSAANLDQRIQRFCDRIPKLASVNAMETDYYLERCQRESGARDGAGGLRTNTGGFRLVPVTKETSAAAAEDDLTEEERRDIRRHVGNLAIRSLTFHSK